MPKSKTDILAEICATTRAETARRKLALPEAALEAAIAAQSPPRGFQAALAAKAQAGACGLIAEIKKASPSKGLIRADFHPAAHAQAYAAGGAACLSVLTDTPYFQGHADYLREARAACALPVLRKDFMLDVWQVREARAMGADAILIIMAALDDAQAADIEAQAHALHMDCLVEVHDEAELERALKLRSTLIGVNNRNLKDFSVDFNRSFALAALAPSHIDFVAESGIDSHKDIVHLAAHGITRVLVGESLMRQADVQTATQALLFGEGTRT